MCHCTYLRNQEKSRTPEAVLQGDWDPGEAQSVTDVQEQGSSIQWESFMEDTVFEMELKGRKDGGRGHFLKDGIT